MKQVVALLKSLLVQKADSRAAGTVGTVKVMPDSDWVAEDAGVVAARAADVRSDFVRTLFCVVDSNSPLRESEQQLLAGLELAISGGTVGNLVPRLSGSLPKLLSMLKSDNSVQSISEQISTDPGLVSSIIRTINSPLYRRREKDIETLSHAVVILGERGLREIIASVTMRPIVATRALAGLNPTLALSLWDDAIASATACRMLADSKQLEDSFSLYLCGLIHGVGLTAILGRLAIRPEQPEMSFTHEFAGAVVQLYPRISHALACSWGFPEPATNALRRYALNKAESSADLEVMRAGVQLAQVHSLARCGRYESLEVVQVLEGTDTEGVYEKLFCKDLAVGPHPAGS